MRNAKAIVIKNYHGIINLKHTYSDDIIPGNTAD